MSNDNQSRSRHSFRLKGYDYSQAGAYFITLVTQNRACLWGEIVNAEIRLNPPGEMVIHWWRELENKFPTLRLGEFVLMPNHLHGILWIVDSLDAKLSLGNAIQWFKSMSTNEYIRGIEQFSWPQFNKRLWQRYFYDHIVRNDDDLENAQLYILDNPRRWSEDAENPSMKASL